jgi:SAM-dependent methyltransferase
MESWKEVEDFSDEYGFIPEHVYNAHVERFQVCPSKTKEEKAVIDGIWAKYLSSTRLNNGNRSMYEEMFRYEWYEGRNRTGFWGNIETAVRRLSLGTAPVITIYSAGSGRDLLKVGLAAGIWGSNSPEHIRGTYKEIDIRYFTLKKPGARIMLTEYDDGNMAALKRTVGRLLGYGLLTREMVSVRRWDFRRPSPVAAQTQDLAVFSLTGNYATLEEQALILGEIARSLKQGGHLVASTMTEAFGFNTNSLWNKAMMVFSAPLTWPVALEFYLWQNRWSKMASEMAERGMWRNADAKVWSRFLEPHGMQEIAIYPAPDRTVPVEVLVSQKEARQEK